MYFSNGNKPIKLKKVVRFRTNQNVQKLSSESLSKALIAVYGDLKYVKSLRTNSDQTKKLCSLLNIKNSIKNRLKIRNLWNRKLYGLQKFQTNQLVGMLNISKELSNSSCIEIDNVDKDTVDASVDLQIDNVKCKIDEIFTGDQLVYSQKDPCETETVINDIPIIFQQGNQNCWLHRCIFKVEINPEVFTLQNLREGIRDALIAAKNNCVLTFKTTNYNKSTDTYVLYAVCKYKTHQQKYKFKVAKKVFVDMYTIGDDIENHGHIKEFVQLRGLRRRDLQNQLENKGPNMVYLEQLENVDSHLLSIGNTHKIARKNVLRKAKSERLHINDLVKECEMHDAINRLKHQSTIDKYIYMASDPLHIILMRSSTLQFLGQTNRIVYIDATGGVVRNPKCCINHNFPRIYYYACVIKVQDTIIPVAELISCRHDAAAIGSFLQYFYYEIIHAKPKIALPKLFVSDWSWVFINSVLKQVNDGITIKQYLNLSYKIVIGQKITENIVGIFVCCSHFAAIIIRQIKKKILQFKKHNIREFIMIVLFSIVDCKSINDIDKLFRIMCLVCCSKYQNALFNKAYAEFLEMSLASLANNCGISENIIHQEREYEGEENEFDHENYNYIDDSPYYKRFSEILNISLIEIETNQSHEQSDRNNEPNSLYCYEFILFCTKKYFTYLPLWSTIFLQHFDEPKRVSNAICENWFNIIKNNLIKEPNQKLGRFIDNLQEKTRLLHNSIELAPHLKGRSKSKVTKSKHNLITPSSRSKIRQDEIEPNTLNLEEFWGKSKTRTNKYAGRAALRKYIKPRILNFNNEDYCRRILSGPDGYSLYMFKYNIHGRDFPLKNDCFASLNCCTYVTSDIIYVAANILLKSTNDICLDPIICIKIYEDKSNTYITSSNFIKGICRDKRRIYLPRCANDHWVLVIIDVIDKKIITYDPLKPNQNIHHLNRKGQQILDQLKLSWNEPSEQFKTEPAYSLPLQQDSFNCGPLIIYAMDFLSNNKHRPKIHTDNEDEYLQEMKSYRNILIHNIAESSLSMAQHCLVCFGIVTDNELTKKCKDCGRQIHQDCNIHLIICNEQCLFCEE